MKAFIYLSLKDEIPDNAGTMVAEKLRELGFAEVANVRIGRCLEVELDGSAGVETQRRLDGMCTQLLVDPELENGKVIKLED